MSNSLDADWAPWTQGAYGVEEGYGHMFMLDGRQTVDLRRMAEKAYRSWRKPQVLHYHGSSHPCTDECIWLNGVEQDAPADAIAAVELADQLVGPGLRVPIVRLNPDGTETRGSARQIGAALDDYRHPRGGPMRIGPGASVCIEVCARTASG